MGSSLLVWMGMAGSAVAGPVDLYGFGAESIGRGQGGVAIPDGALTAFRNPALLQDQDMAQAVIGFGLYRGRFPKSPPVYWDTNRDGMVGPGDNGLQIQAQSPQADSLTVAMGRNIGERFGVAINGLLPVQQILRLRTTEPSLPTWVMYGNRSERFEIAAGMGAEVYKGLSIGASFEMVAKARYRVNATFTAVAGGVEGEDAELADAVDTIALDVHDMTLDLVPRFVPIAGFSWEVGELVPALDGLRAGMSWRGASGIPVDADIDLQINGSLEDMGDLEPTLLTLVLPLEFHIFDHYVPERWSYGLSYELKGLRGYVDVHRTLWSGIELNVAHVTEAEIRSQFLQIDKDSIEDENRYQATFSDTWGFNTGVEVWLPPWRVKGPVESVAAVLRGGLGMVPSPLSAQGSDSYLLDADRLLYTVGLGVTHGLPPILAPGPMSWDTFFSTHSLADGKLTPVDAGPDNPGSPVNGKDIPIGGHLWSMGIQSSVEF